MDENIQIPNENEENQPDDDSLINESNKNKKMNEQNTQISENNNNSMDNLRDNNDFDNEFKRKQIDISKCDFKLFPLDELPGAYYAPSPFLDEKISKEWLNTIPEIIKPNIQCRLSPRGPIFAAYGEEQKDIFPNFFEYLFKKCSPLLLNRPFQCSVNIYDSLECELQFHKDAEGSQVLIISLGSSICLSFIKRENFFFDSPENEKYFKKVFLEDNSLLLLTQNSFFDFLHGIETKEGDEISNCLNKNCCFQNEGFIKRKENRISLVIWNK